MKRLISFQKYGRWEIGTVILAILFAVTVPARAVEKKVTASPKKGQSPAPLSPTAVKKERGSPPSGPSSLAGRLNNAPKMMTMKINEAIMVTAELDFGKPPSVAQALREIDRLHQPADGVGRTFAVIDAYGEPTPKGKLHLSMHVSTEKPGLGSLVFRRTGEILWQAKIEPAAKPGSSTFSGKNLTILVDNGKGQTNFVDGSKNPSSILTANVRELNVPVGSLWPDGAVREMTFIYSACGCPVHVKVKRAGNKTVRTEELPVIFPDDPAAVMLINQLMGW